MQRDLLHAARVAFLLFIAFALLRAVIAEAKNLNNKLKGDYEYTLSRDCVRNQAGFDEDLRLEGPGAPRAMNVLGTITYDGVGEGTIVATGTNHFHYGLQGTGNLALSKFNAECNLTYTVNPDMSFTQWISCNWEDHLGNTGTRTGTVMQGQITNDGKILLLADPDSNVETITSPSGTSYAICGRSGMAVKLK